MDLSRDTVLWFAGLFEGEGCIAEGRRKKGPSCWFLQLSSTDRDVIERVHKAFGGSVHEVKPSGLAKKPAWSWALSRQPLTYAVAAAIYPFMSARRKARLEQYFDQFSKRPSIREARRNAAFRSWQTRGAKHDREVLLPL